MADLSPITDHDAPPGAFAVPGPLTTAAPAPMRSAAEEARTLVAGAKTATLATLSADGHPWASFVAYADRGDGVPVLLVSTLAEHGRNLLADARCSLVVAGCSGADDDPLDSGRVTITGRARRPDEGEHAATLRAFTDAAPTAKVYASFSDFTLWLLHPERIRWVGGYGRMDSATLDAYREAEADPVAPLALAAVSHLNEDHADALLEIARALAGFTDATACRCSRADRYGLDLVVDTPRGRADPRVGFSQRVEAADGLRGATVELVRRARDVAATA